VAYLNIPLGSVGEVTGLGVNQWPILVPMHNAKIDFPFRDSASVYLWFGRYHTITATLSASVTDASPETYPQSNRFSSVC
jgi:hypothetical protein